MELCPNNPDILTNGTPLSIKIVANICRYGIITTNGKSLDFQGV